MMNSKSLRILHLFCLLLHLSFVSCEPPEEETVQRYQPDQFLINYKLNSIYYIDLFVILSLNPSTL